MVPVSPSARDPLLSDAEFKTELDIIANEVYEATYLHHVMEEINDLARSDENILTAMNEQPLFWQAHRSASQAALFMCLGRIFDTGEATNSIHRLVRITRANLQVFSKAALGARKMGHGQKPPWLDVYLNGVWEPQTAADLKFLKDALKPHAAHFEVVYKPIRHSVYGHRLMSDDEAGVALFPQTSREAVGKILDFLHDLVEAITELYLNGRPPELGRRDFKAYNQRIRDDARNVMRRVVQQAG
jgi:hypothetical protein